jgi:hypothetical protein
MIKDNDAVHIEVCRVWLNSDEADTNPQVTQLVLQHAQLHVMNMYKQQLMQSVVAGAGPQQQGQEGQGGADASGQKGGPGQPQQGGGQGKGPQSGKKGGQVPQSPQKRQQRAEKGQAAKPHRPQPPAGNQHHVKRLT